MSRHQYTAQEIAFIREELPGRSHRAFTELFNQRFGLELSVSQVTGAAKNRKINNGLDGRIKPGSVPPNKGKKGITYPGREATQFKRGQFPHNYMPVGSERVNTYGYTDVKIADPHTWKLKHVLLWEAVNGPVPKGHKLLFGDGDKRNITLENILLVTNAEMAMLNKYKLYGGSMELTQAGVNIARLLMEIRAKQRTRKREKGDGAHDRPDLLEHRTLLTGTPGGTAHDV